MNWKETDVRPDFFVLCIPSTGADIKSTGHGNVLIWETFHDLIVN